MTVQATIQMWGNTRAVRIPKAIAQELGLETGTPVTLTRAENGLLVQPVRAKKRYTLSELLAECKGRNPHREAIREGGEKRSSERSERGASHVLSRSWGPGSSEFFSVC